MAVLFRLLFLKMLYSGARHEQGEMILKIIIYKKNFT